MNRQRWDLIALTIIPKANAIPTKPKALLDCSLTIIAPVPQKTKANVPINSARYFFIIFDKKRG